MSKQFTGTKSLPNLPLNKTKDIKWTELNHTPKKDGMWNACAIYDGHNKQIIIFCLSKNTHKIYSYDINLNSYRRLAKYPNLRRLPNLIILLHESYNIVSLGIDKLSSHFILYNTISNTFDLAKNSMYSNILINHGIGVKHIVNPSNKNEYHIIGGLHINCNDESFHQVINLNSINNDINCKIINKSSMKSLNLNNDDHSSLSSKLSHKPNYMYGHGLFFDNSNNIIMFGGFHKYDNNDYASPSNLMYKYNLKLNEWILLSDNNMLDKIAGFSFINYNNKYIIIFGGQVLSNNKTLIPTNAIYYLDIIQMKWYKSNIVLPNSIYNHCSILTDNNYVYIFGGKDIRDNNYENWCINIGYIIPTLYDNNNNNNNNNSLNSNSHQFAISNINKKLLSLTGLSKYKFPSFELKKSKKNIHDHDGDSSGDDR